MELRAKVLREPIRAIHTSAVWGAGRDNAVQAINTFGATSHRTLVASAPIRPMAGTGSRISLNCSERG